MSEKTDIGWTDSTISPWFICTEQSPGCLECYARELTEQKFAFVSKDGDPMKSGVIRRAYFKAGFKDWPTRYIWGNKATRVLSKGFWSEAIKWNRQAAKSGVRRKIFPSLMDWLDDFPAGVIDQEGNNLSPEETTARFLDVVRMTPNLDWLLLTKRIEDWKPLLEAAWDIYQARPAFPVDSQDATVWLGKWLDGQPPQNVWLGVSVEDQKRADERIPLLLKTPAAVRFLSVEPLLEKVELFGWQNEMQWKTPLPKTWVRKSNPDEIIQTQRPDWVIVGGESGKNRRDCGVEAIESVVLQCANAGVPCFCKQDSALLPGQKGRLSDNAWSFKEFPNATTQPKAFA